MGGILQGDLIHRGSLSGDIAFKPTKLAGLTLWLRADLGITLVSGDVSAWADQSGQGNDATQGTATLRPTFVAAGGAKFNGAPHMQFRNASFSQRLVIPDDASLRALATGYHVYCVAGVGVLGAANDFFLGKGTDGWRFRHDSTERLRCFLRNAANTANYSVTIAAPDMSDVEAHVCEMSYDGSNTMTVFLDTGTATDTEVGVRTDETNDLGIGAVADGSLDSDSDIAEIVIYQRQLVSSERATLASYFNARYGTAA